MNKRFLLPVLAILCSTASNNVKAEEKFKDLSKQTAEALLKALRYEAYAYNAQQEADAGNEVVTPEFVSATKQRAKEAIQDVINFGCQTANEPKDQLAILEYMMGVIEQDLNDATENLKTPNDNPSFGNAFTQYARTIATNKWTKKTAGITVTCTIAKLLYNKYTISNESKLWRKRS